jgi:hypothetical protein
MPAWSKATSQCAVAYHLPPCMTLPSRMCKYFNMIQMALNSLEPLSETRRTVSYHPQATLHLHQAPCYHYWYHLRHP